MSNYKAQATAQFVAEMLTRRTGLAAVVGFTAAPALDPLISLGTIGIGAVGALVKILDQRGGASEGWQALPGFGAVAQPVYTGTVIQICVENISALGAFPITLAHLFRIVGELTRRGARVELYTQATGVAPAFDGVEALVASFDGNIYWPLSDRV